MQNIQSQLNNLNKQVSEINSHLCLIHTQNMPEIKSLNLKLALLKLIDDEHLERENRNHQGIILGLSNNQNDRQSISRIFQFLKQE